MEIVVSYERNADNLLLVRNCFFAIDYPIFLNDINLYSYEESSLSSLAKIGISFGIQCVPLAA